MVLEKPKLGCTNMPDANIFSGSSSSTVTAYLGLLMNICSNQDESLQVNNRDYVSQEWTPGLDDLTEVMDVCFRREKSLQYMLHVIGEHPAAAFERKKMLRAFFRRVKQKLGLMGLDREPPLWGQFAEIVLARDRLPGRMLAGERFTADHDAVDFLATCQARLVRSTAVTKAS